MTSQCIVRDSGSRGSWRRSRPMASMLRNKRHGRRRLKPAEREQEFQLTFMSTMNLITGAAGVALLIWGVVARAL